MKIALLSIQDYSHENNIREEAGLGIIASCLRRIGHEVLLTVIDSNNMKLDKVINFEPYLIGFGGYLKDKDYIVDLSHQLKCVNKNFWICVGGVLPTYYPKELLCEADSVDFVVLGEGEATLLGVVDCIEKGESIKGVKGIAYKEKGEMEKESVLNMRLRVHMLSL